MREKDLKVRMLKALVRMGYEYDQAVEMAFFDVRRALKIINSYKQNNKKEVA